MKRRLTALLAAVMLLGVGIAVAVGTTGADPMISKSYWENTYLPSLTQALQKRAGERTKTLYDAAVTKLDGLGEADVKAAQDPGANKGGYVPTQVNAGDSLTLGKGDSVVLYSGECRLSAGILADVTQGTEVATGSVLIANHRYIVTTDQAVTLDLVQAGALGYQGSGTLKRVGTGDLQTQGPGGTVQAFPFADVKAEDWYYDAITFVYQKGYFAGTGANAFSPNAPMDRAMVATVLHRLAGSESVSGGAGFDDVPDGQWYSQGIAWASAKGVVNGMGDNRYEPGLAVTREQLVTMFYRYEKEYRGVNVSKTGMLETFPDGQTVSAWAKDAVSWAVGNGLIQGRDTGHLDPAGTATRAEVATILQRFSTLLESN